MGQPTVSAVKDFAVSGGTWQLAADFTALAPDLPWAIDVRYTGEGTCEVLVPTLYGGDNVETPGEDIDGWVMAGGEVKTFGPRTQRLTGTGARSTSAGPAAASTSASRGRTG
jgi:hypothetical protein